MKVGHIKDSAPVDIGPRIGTRAGGTTETGERPAAGATDSVQFSDASKALQAGKLPLTGRAEEIRKAIEDGNYPINVDKIADSMISESARLLQTLRGIAPPSDQGEAHSS